MESVEQSSPIMMRRDIVVSQVRFQMRNGCEMFSRFRSSARKREVHEPWRIVEQTEVHDPSLLSQREEWLHSCRADKSPKKLLSKITGQREWFDCYRGLSLHCRRNRRLPAVKDILSKLNVARAPSATYAAHVIVPQHHALRTSTVGWFEKWRD
jgi:hypothetical protein